MGVFVGEVRALWLDVPPPDRNMQLLADFAFHMPGGEEWKAPVKSTVNGASIPRALWSFLGSPYIGNYRLASVVHDVACEPGSGKSRKAADRMFYNACREGGCNWIQAKALYIGVRIGAWVSGDSSLRQTEAAEPPYAPVQVVTDEEATIIDAYQRAHYLTESIAEDDLDTIDEAVIASMKLALGLRGRRLD